ncbi:coiled-coil domain-containing protein 73 isoform X5 [Oryzias latipes]|uniref:coiled-coil domain-containing protein 73 isoform X5 n=1 Tax=Oryzias latipes TaxID=8090 RepID=UPI0009DB15A6|nr:coiled-coil domain-containing protein 73 isoform X5 [Oryzias latipes]
MEGSADSGTPPTHIAFSGPASEPELSWSSSHSQTESEGTILLQLLEFKTHLLEVVEELHIRRDAEARFEDQTSKLVLEKQELEWEKESLQHQNETVTKQHAELLTAAKKEFQAKLRHIEEEKGKHQANAELKEKEINNLKEELKSLQVKLLKYNLEKKSSELEQKLALQSRTKDSHLNQLGEVEKRFSALSKQCAMVKKAHEQLQQNADEAMRINRKLTFANQKQEATIMSLKKELDEVNNKLIKVKMTSVRYEKTHSQAEGQQQVQELQQRLIMEKDINRKLEKENLAERAEKQEMLRSLQRTQELLLRQTQTVRRVEMELKTQTERFQALQHKHEVMREQSKAMQDRLAQLSESFTASKSRWDKELFSAEVEGKGEIPVECIHSSERPDCSLQDLMSSQANEGNQKETEAASAADAGTTTEEMTDKHPHSQPATTIDDRLLQSDDPVPSRETRTTNSIINSFEAGEQNPSSNLIPNDPSDAAALQSNVNIQTASSRKCESPDKLAHLQTNEEHDKELEENEEKPNKQEGCSLDHQDGEDIRDEDVKNESGVEKIRDKEAIEPQGHRNLETQGNDQPDGDTMNEVEWRGQTAQHAPDQKMVAQAGTDVTEDTVPLQVNEPMAEEPPRCELSEAPSQKVTDNDFCHFNEEHQADPEDGLLSSEEPQPLGHDAVQTSCENSPSLHNQSVCQESDQPANENPQRKATDFPTECQDISTYSHLNVTPLSAHFPIETRRTEAGDFSDTDSIVKHVDEAQVHQKSESVKINPSKAELQSPSEDADQRKGHFNVKACENSTCTTVSTSVRTCWLTEEAAYHDPEAQTGRYEKQMSNDTPKDAAEKETHPKVSIHSSHESNNSLKISESSVAGMKNYNSLFDWNKARIKTLGSREKPDLHHLRQGGFFSGLNSVGSDEIQARQPVSASLFIKNRQSKVPLVMMRASDLLSASSGSADAATSRKRHEREWEAKGRICSESPAGETKSTASISRLQDVSGSVGKLPLQNVPECSRASTSASGLISGPKSNPSFSLEMENQQTLFREQVSKIERFLNAERLRTSKRQRTDN